MKRRNNNTPDFGPAVGKVLIGFVFLFLVIVLLISIVRIREKYTFVKEGRNTLKEEIAETQASIDLLEGSLEHLDTPGGTDRALREQFRVTSEGEELIVIVPDQS